MTDIVDITPPVRYSFAERSAARLNLSKSRFFLVLGLGAQLETEQNPLPATLSSCSRPNVVLKVVRLASKEKFWSRDQNSRILIELKGRQSPKSRIATANRIVSAIGGLFAHVHHTAYHDLAPYQIPKELIRGTELSVEQVEELQARTGRDPYPFGIRARLGSFVIIPEPPTARSSICSRLFFKTRICSTHAVFSARVVQSSASWMEWSTRFCTSRSESPKTKLKG